MGSQADIQAMESIIVEHAGPMGKFIIKKSISDLGLENGSVSPEQKNQLINMVLERAVFDKDRWSTIRREIISAWGD